MTTNAMNCDVFTDRLMAYLEHETDDATRAAMERHAAACAECGPMLADVRKIRADAANLPELAPSRDLWAGIASRIEAPVVAIGARESRRTPLWSRTPVRIALFAASLVAAAGIGYLSAGTRQPDVTGQVAQAPDSVQVVVANVDSMIADTTERATSTIVQAPVTPVSRPAPATAVALPAELAIATLTRDYDREVARLRILINERRNQLDPATVAVIERNIQVIDAAILDSKQAIAADPSSAFLIESLNQSLRTKVELMRTAAALPIRM